ncbi:MAG: hypothetical protein WAV45_12655, partial [Propionibacteriaceae bacterium]
VGINDAAAEDGDQVLGGAHGGSLAAPAARRPSVRRCLCRRPCSRCRASEDDKRKKGHQMTAVAGDA